MTTLTTQLVHRPCRHSADLTLAMLLDRVPAALPFLVRPGFPPLAESLLRKRSAPRVTIRQAAETLPINLERLLTDLERLDDAEVAS
ncbi:MAG TPA: hypothetical protein VNL16_15320 [Chloroflexota bacterium]|nr:hypothetical protein [Chloroflexota bacterium]